MSEWIENVEPLTLKGQIKVPYNWSVGEVGSRFLVSLRDDQKIIGNRCGECQDRLCASPYELREMF